MSDEVLYDQQVIAFLEEIWGDGFLSPGGADEVRRVLQGVTIDGKTVIDWLWLRCMRNTISQGI